MWIHPKESPSLKEIEKVTLAYEHCPGHFTLLTQAVDKLTLPEERRNKIQFVEKKPTKAFEDVHEILQNILDDPEARIFFSTNYIIKLYISHAVTRLLETYFNDDFLKKCLRTLLGFLNIEFDQTKLVFHDERLVEIYGSILAKQIPSLCDLAINESFYGDEENDYSMFQSAFLSLIVYVIKTVSLKTIFSVGFKPKHLQFLIIHFTKAPQIPEILLAIAENLSNPSKLYENEEANEAVSVEVQVTINYQIYTVSMKSIPLLLKLYTNNPGHLRTISATSQRLASYGKDNKFSEQATLFLIKDLLKKINTETDNAKYRNYRCSWININAKLIECHFDNLSDSSKKKLLNSIMCPLKRILNKMAAYGAFRKLSKTETFTRNICFSIIAKLINVNKIDVQFVRDHLKYKDSKAYIEQTWLNAIESHNEAACVAFISLSRGSASYDKSRSQLIYGFMLKVLAVVENNLKSEANSGSALSLDLKVLVAIADFYSTNIYKNTIKTGLLPVMNNAVDKLKALTCTSEEHLELFFQFLIKMIQVTFTSKFRPTGFFREHILTTLEMFDDLINMNFEFKINKKTYGLSLELIKLIAKYFSPDTLVLDYRVTFLEILFQIEANLDPMQSEEASEFEKLVVFFEEQDAPCE